MATTEQLEQNTASVETAREQRYKYIVLGETFYFTREEIEARILRVEDYKDMPKACLDKIVNERIKDILKYDGDPYGCCTGALHEMLQEADATGVPLTIY